METSGSFIWSFWVPAIMCAFSLALVTIYALFERSIPEINRPMTGAKRAAQRAERGVVEEKVSMRTRWEYMTFSIAAIPACFWIVTITQVRPIRLHPTL
jgi:hypothetical protein